MDRLENAEGSKIIKPSQSQTLPSFHNNCRGYHYNYIETEGVADKWEIRKHSNWSTLYLFPVNYFVLTWHVAHDHHIFSCYTGSSKNINGICWFQYTILWPGHSTSKVHVGDERSRVGMPVGAQRRRACRGTGRSRRDHESGVHSRWGTPAGVCGRGGEHVNRGGGGEHVDRGGGREDGGRSRSGMPTGAAKMERTEVPAGSRPATANTSQDVLDDADPDIVLAEPFFRQPA